MTALREFLELIEVAGEPLGKEHKAYRMDGEAPRPDMRRKADLGPCNCCDYFIFSKEDDSVVLIEETQLIRQIKHLKSKFNYLKDSDQIEFIKRSIREENKLKVYGSMLVLCRLASVCKNLHQTKKYKFWLIASGIESEEDTILIDNLKDRLLNDLRTVICRQNYE